MMDVPETPWEMLEKVRVQGCLGKDPRTLAAYRNLLMLHPEMFEAWAEYGDLLLSMNRLEDAREALARALGMDPNNPRILANLAKAHHRLGHWEESGALFERLLAAVPERLEARLDLAWSLMQRNHLAQARSVLERAAAQAPGNPMVTHLLIQVLIQQEDWPALRLEMLRRVNTDYIGAQAEWERSCVNLAFGATAEGWEQQESRWELPGVEALKREFPQPLWNGQSFEGQTLLLHCEQGLGDTLMFVRYASMVKRRGGRVLLLAQAELKDLMGTCPGVDEVIPEGAPLPGFDFHLPLLSLPRVFQTDLDSIPAEVPYLGIPEHVPNREGIAEILVPSQGQTRVGLSWAGSSAHVRDSQRSIPLELLAPLDVLPNVTWCVLQPGVRELPSVSNLISLGPLLNNFSDTAYALSGMDLVITVDTALAHLAGALGIPTLLLISYLPDWRWMLGRSDSPWYPAMRIYRQPRPGDWASVIGDILRDLSEPEA